MDNSRMSTADMLQYCNEALAWEEFGPVDIFFFESVKKIILGQCTPFDLPEEDIDDLMGIERPVTEDELAADYDKYADEYYYEENEEITEVRAAAHSDEGAFSAKVFNDGFFEPDEEEIAHAQTSAEENEGSFTVKL